MIHQFWMNSKMIRIRNNSWRMNLLYKYQLHKPSKINLNSVLSPPMLFKDQIHRKFYSLKQIKDQKWLLLRTKSGNAIIHHLLYYKISRCKNWWITYLNRHQMNALYNKIRPSRTLKKGTLLPNILIRNLKLGCAHSTKRINYPVMTNSMLLSLKTLQVNNRKQKNRVQPRVTM